MTVNHPDDELADLRARMRAFIDGEVIPAEPVLTREGDDARKTLDGLRSRAKELGLWALGHPADVGGGGVPFLDFVYLNEIIGRSEFGQLAVGSVSMQDTLMLRKHGTEEQKKRWIPPLVAGDFLPSVGLTEPDDIAAAILGHLRAALEEIEAVADELAEAEEVEV